MPSASTILSSLALLAIPAVNAAFGPAFSTGPVANNTFIRESNATLVLPAVPTDNEGDLSLWVGMGTSNGDLIQSIAENYNEAGWSVYAYTLLVRDNYQYPIQGPSASAAATNKITMHYLYDDCTGNYTQTVWVNGVTVSTLSSADDQAEGWGSAVECADTNCGTVPAHSWENVEIVMDVADPDYIDTLGKSTGVTGDLVTSDGGLTWTVDVISIPEFTFTS